MSTHNFDISILLGQNVHFNIRMYMAHLGNKLMAYHLKDIEAQH